MYIWCNSVCAKWTLWQRENGQTYVWTEKVSEWYNMYQIWQGFRRLYLTSKMTRSRSRQTSCQTVKEFYHLYVWIRILSARSGPGHLGHPKSKSCSVALARRLSHMRCSKCAKLEPQQHVQVRKRCGCSLVGDGFPNVAVARGEVLSMRPIVR